MLNRATIHTFQSSTVSKEEASRLLWAGTRAAIDEWDRAADPTGEGLYADVLDAFAAPRRSAASKIKSVALAVAAYDLDLALYNNLSAAYTAAKRRANVDKPKKVKSTHCTTCTCQH